MRKLYEVTWKEYTTMITTILIVHNKLLALRNNFYYALFGPYETCHHIFAVLCTFRKWFFIGIVL